ncbi:MAG: hypothetical protein M1817_004081 [Caeruleum heppii]|nr:MAG: hypothetical protein M1817_004081 [Caeruleum heppii]
MATTSSEALSAPPPQPSSSPSSSTAAITTPRPVIYLPTIEAYDRWAEVYDTDSNILQSIDSLELTSLLPIFLKTLPFPITDRNQTIADLGCGTGRNTLSLLERGARNVLGLDVSSKMLGVARRRCGEYVEGLREEEESKEGRRESAPMVRFDMFDALAGSDEPVVGVPNGVITAVISTLVIEHLPLPDFFRTVIRLLADGEGRLLLTNMHQDMGALSQAGFVDPATGQKVRPKSYVHSIDEVLREATRWGFELAGEVRERAVMAEEVEMLGQRSRKWVGVKVWFGMVLIRRATEKS